jgi:hypothetical protein
MLPLYPVIVGELLDHPDQQLLLSDAVQICLSGVLRKVIAYQRWMDR